MCQIHMAVPRAQATRNENKHFNNGVCGFLKRDVDIQQLPFHH